MQMYVYRFLRRYSKQSYTVLNYFVKSIDVRHKIVSIQSTALVGI